MKLFDDFKLHFTFTTKLTMLMIKVIYMETYLKLKLSQHPFDWIIHFTLCFIPILFDWATWFVVIFVAVMIEYEQRWQTWYANKPLKEYILKDSLPDIFAGLLGIITAIIIKQSDIVF